MIFGYIGITDVTFVQAGGTARVMKQEISAQEFLAPFVSQAQAAV
jgi:FMN-dependent NADH-azoreductase